MRAFIAVDIPERFRFEAAGLARQLAASVKGRFVDPASYHVTLAFLGDIDERGVRSAKAAIEAAYVAGSPIRLASDGLGKFGKSHDATLWLGLEPHETLMQLAVILRDELMARDIPFDGKPFKPHITLARRASIPNAPLPALAFPEPAIATAVTLYKSELSSEGATYYPL